IFGYEKNDIIYSYLPLIPEEIFSNLIDLKNSLIKKGKADKLSTQRILEDGTLLEVELSCYIKNSIEKEGKTAICFQLDKIRKLKEIQSAETLSNIKKFNSKTQKKVNEKKVHKPNINCEEIITNFPESLIIIDSEGKITFANEYSKNLTGYAPSELIDKPLSFLTNAPKDEFEKKFSFIQKKEVSLPVKIKLQAKTGDSIPVEIRSSIIHSESGEVTGFALMIRDISVQQQRDELIDYLRDYIESTIESLDDAIITANDQNSIIYWNKGAEKIFGYSSAEAIGKSIFMILPEEGNGQDDESASYSVKDKNLLRKRLLGDESIQIQSIEEQLVNKKGEKFPALVSLSVPCDKKGNPIIGNVLLIKDITERKKLEEQLLHSEKLASLGSMISGITHELNNKLAPILGYSQIIKEMNVDGELSEMISKIELSAKGARNIIHSLLGFARHNKPQFKNVNINEIIMRVVKLFKYKIDVSNIKLIPRLDESLPETMADETQIEQVFLNMINNSFQALSGNEGEIIIESSIENKSIVIKISDNGPGIPKENLKRIFDPFFTTKEPQIGTGLGLSLCYGIINNHKGSISVESKPYKKTTFTIKLPIVKTSKAAEVEEKEQGISYQQQKEQKKILVIDDDSMIRDLIFSILNKKHRVEIADNGKTALEKIKNCTYDLIISDLRMPGIDGFSLYNILKEKNAGIEKSVIFTTGDTYDPKTKKFIEETKTICLPKPFNINDLLEIVNNFFKKNETIHQAQ
ncbi:MAG: PAS domain S-box protein, partial [Candidatus Schekmanbacteria bacterium]